MNLSDTNVFVQFPTSLVCTQTRRLFIRKREKLWITKISRTSNSYDVCAGDERNLCFIIKSESVLLQSAFCYLIFFF